MLASLLLSLPVHPTGVGIVLTDDVVIPNPPATPLPGPAAQAVQTVVGYIKWVAGLGLAGLFFGGLVAYGAGRVIDHRHYGRVGTMMMVCAFGGALLYASGYSLITAFASGK